MLLLAYVSHATRLFGSCLRHASSTASEIVSQTLSGWPSPTDSEEKMNFLFIMERSLGTVFQSVQRNVSTYQDGMIHQLGSESIGLVLSNCDTFKQCHLQCK